VNSTLTLIRYAAVKGKGWRRGSVVLTRNGKLKPDVMTIGGAEVNCPNGRYERSGDAGQSIINYLNISDILKLARAAGTIDINADVIMDAANPPATVPGQTVPSIGHSPVDAE
jgi:hypothetical protein